MTIKTFTFFRFFLLFTIFCLATTQNIQAQCTGLGSITLNIVAAPNPTINAPTQLCPSATGTASVNQTFSSYLWSTTATTQSTSVPGPGTYTVTVTNAAGCTNTASVNIAASSGPNPNISQGAYACNGQFTLNAGAGFSSYTWSTSANQQQITVNLNGTYTVTVTDGSGCTGTDAITVTIPSPPVVNINGDNSFCAGTSNILTATAGFNQYSWSNAGSAAQTTVTTAGTYTVTATDNFGCTDTESITVSTVPNPTPGVANAALCPGNTAILTATGGSFPNYNWSGGTNSGANTTVDQAGTYTVTVTAANGCTGTASANVSLLPVPNPVITQSVYACNGQFTLSTAAGFTNYAWSNSVNNQTQITVNQSGTYTVTVTNSSGCTGTDELLVTIPTPPVVNITGDNQICTGENTVLQATAGFNTYLWNNNSGQPQITVSASGTYTVTATDAFGCSDSETFTLTVLAAPTPTISGPTQFCDGTSVVLSVPATFSDYDWSSGTSGQPTTTITQGGTYTVTVTAANGCTGTDTQTVTELTAPAPAIFEQPYACNNTLVLTLGGGTFTNIAWSNSVTNQTQITITQSNLYAVTVTSANGCTGTAEYQADIPPPTPQVVITGSSTICPGANGTLTASAGFANYVWSNTAVTPTITINAGGNYEVTATDAFGCTSVDAFGVSVLNAPQPTISGPSQICAGGSATFSVPGSFAGFAWSTTSNQPAITVNQAGTYTVTVTAANGCTGTDTQVLTVSNSLQPNIAELPYACNDQIVLDAGSGFQSYAWSNTGNQQQTTVTGSGTYTVTVTDATGCSGTAQAVVDIPLPPLVSISGNANICAGTNAVLTASAGLNAYVWSTTGVGPTITINTGGTYEVTATDAFGCTAVDDFVVTAAAAPAPNISGPTVICVNSNGTLEAGAGFTNYTWSTTENTPQIIVTQAGTYTVTVTNAQGCTGTDSQTVTVANGLSPTIATAPYACNGQLNLNAGAGFTNYAWSTTGNTQQITVNSSGTYTVTVTDATGCTGTATTVATIPAAPIVAVNGSNAICAGTNTVLSATAGFAAYVWSTTDINADITVSANGTYTVTATDAFGCTATSSFTLNVVALPQPNISGPTVICVNSNGTLDAGAGFTNYTWSTTENTPQIIVTQAGTYTVTVTNAQGCTGTDSQTVAVANGLSPTIATAPYACNDQLNLDAGAGYTTYAWSTTGNTQQITVNSSGTYTVTVTDATGCTGTATTIATIPAAPIVAVSGSNAICAGTSTVLSATAGFAAYVWSTTDISADITVNASGTYTVTATDALGCTATSSFTLNVVALPQPNISGPTVICVNSNGTLDAGAGFTNYTWSTTENTPQITVTQAGTYTVTVTNAQGCTGTDSQTVAVANGLSPTIVTAPYTCNGQLNLDAGVGYTTYAWSTTGNTQQITVNSSGTYTVTVTDATGCTGTATTVANIPAAPIVAVSGSNAICAGTSTVLSATAGFAAYVWSTTDISADITVNASGTYTVTATDALGCTATSSFTLNVVALPQPNISGPTVICVNSNGTLDAGAGFTNYTWSTTENTPQITVTQAGTYTVTVTNAQGCTGTDSQTVAVANGLSPTIAIAPYACNGQLNLDAGAGYTTYAWSTTGNTQQITVNSSGTYTVTVTDATGCTGTATSTVNVPVAPQISIAGDLNFCTNSSTTLTATPGFVQYAWSNNLGNQNQVAIDQAGTFTVTATDALGCTATASVTTGLFPLPTPVIGGPTTDCPGNTATLNVVGNYAGLVWSTGSTTAAITVQPPFTGTVTVTDANGCSGSASTTVSVSTLLTPVVNLLPYACNGQLTLDAGPGYDNYAWSNNAGNLAQITVTQSGTYTVTVSNNNGCSGTATVSANVPSVPFVEITGSTVLCNGTSGILTATAGFVQYSWSTGSNQAQITVNQANTYGVTVTDTNGCTATDSQTIATGNLTPVLQTNELLCQGTNITIGVTGSYTQYSWSNGSSGSSLVVSLPGVYTVTVTDAQGCTGSTSSEILAVPPAVVNIVGNNTLCAGGTLTLTGTGSVGTYQWSTGSNQPNVTITQGGVYTVTLTDANGCTSVTAATITETQPVTTILNATTCRPAEVGTQTFNLTAANGCDSVVTVTTTLVSGNSALELELGAPILATPGVPVSLDITGNFAIDSVAFVSPFVLSCSDCLAPEFTPTQSGFITVTAFDEKGCSVSDDINVVVQQKVRIYVPNTFQPGSNDNGFFAVFSGPEITLVRNFRVYDRWGNALFSRNDLPTNDPEAGWDGSFRNKPMDPGVYVYAFVVTLPDGSEEVYSGDVTLVR
jgi:trimeric autotransporter adhesin